MSTHIATRPCWRCLEAKPWDDAHFPLGKTGRRRTPVCWGCTEAQAYAKEAAKAKRRATWINPKNGKKVRRCSRCEKVKLLNRKNFYHMGSYGFNVYCKRCFDSYRKVLIHRSPEALEHQRARSRAGGKRYAERHPERVKAQRKNYYERIKADPLAYAKTLEDHRINHRLRREREGHVVVKFQPAQTNQPESYRHRLPAPPLAAFIDERITWRQEIDRAMGFDERDVVSAGQICEDLGIEARALLAWRTGERKEVQLGVAERVLLNADAEWEAIWPAEVYTDLYAEGGPFGVALAA